MCEVLGGEEGLILVCEVNKLNLINKILNEEEKNKISYCVIARVNPENMVISIILNLLQECFYRFKQGGDDTCCLIYCF